MKKLDELKHPIQPIGEDESGVHRFKENAIVNYLLEHSGLDLNDLACVTFPQDDREQFAQLIGYSLSGFGELSYVRDDTYDAANAMQNGKDEKDARIESLQKTLAKVRKHGRKIATAVFRIHEDDLHE